MVDPKIHAMPLWEPGEAGCWNSAPGGIVRVYDTTNSTLQPLNFPASSPLQLAVKLSTRKATSGGHLPECEAAQQAFAGRHLVGFPALADEFQFPVQPAHRCYDQKWIVSRGVGIGVVV
jgi:hypothetical protein